MLSGVVVSGRTCLMSVMLASDATDRYHPRRDSCGNDTTPRSAEFDALPSIISEWMDI